MSKFTTEVRFICEEACGLLESKGYNDIDDIIAKAIPKIFNFNFPIFDENYRSVLETKILKHFYTREIGEETVGLWKLRLNTRLNEIMPYYNKLYESELLEFNPLYTIDLTKINDGNIKTNANNSEKIDDKANKISDTSKTSNEVSNSVNENNKINNALSKNSTITTANDNVQNSNTEWNLYSDTPQGAIANIDDESYLTNATKNTNNGTSTSKTDNLSNSDTKMSSVDKNESKISGLRKGGEKITGIDTNNYNRLRNAFDNSNTTENYLERIVGYNGSNASKLLSDYRSTFINIDVMILNELEDLFFQLW